METRPELFVEAVLVRIRKSPPKTKESHGDIPHHGSGQGPAGEETDSTSQARQIINSVPAWATQ